jgi:hypothetical protein
MQSHSNNNQVNELDSVLENSNSLNKNKQVKQQV